MKPSTLSRRALLRGAGVACALPALEAMAAPARARPPGARPRRLCVLYVPNGVSIPPPDDPLHAEWSWFPIPDRDARPDGDTAFRFTRTLAALEPLRARLSVIGGLSHPRSRELLGHAAGDTFLTGGDIHGEYRNSVSLDQVAAAQLGRATRHACAILSCDGGVGYKTRVSTLSFGPGGNPLPSESSPRQIFERYCTAAATGSARQQRRELRARRKVVDLIKADAAELTRRLGREDRLRLQEYLGSLAELEDRIDRAEAWIGQPLKPGDAGALQLDRTQASPAEYIRTMLDLLVLMFQTDVTRVATYMLAREDGMGWGDRFPTLALGLPGGHHHLSHDRTEGAFLRWARYDQFLAEQLAYFLDRLARTRDEHGPLLDDTLVLYGSACSTTHNARNYPLVLAGGDAMGIRHGRYRRFSDSVPLANLYVGILAALGVPATGFADSTGRIDV